MVWVRDREIKEKGRTLFALVIEVLSASSFEINSCQ